MKQIPVLLSVHSDNIYWVPLVQFSRSVVSDSLQPMNHSTPGLPVHYQLPESTQTHVHWVGSVQFSSVTQSCPTLCNPWIASLQASLSITTSQSSPKPMCIELVMPSSHLILCHLLLLPPSILPSIRVFSNESALRIRCPKYWSLSFNISPSNEYPGLISFRMDRLDLLAVQGTLKSLL